MSNIDRQRIAAVKALEQMGYEYRDDKWLIGDAIGGSQEADALHGLLIKRADQLQGCSEGSAQAQELAAIANAADAYEQKRWPDGKVAGGKG